jgi:nucleoside-diphosphate-sugar epimerase
LKPNISILGCGWLGQALAKSLVEKRFNVYASNRTKKESLNGIKTFAIDIEKRDNDFSSFLSSEVLILAITSKSSTDFKYLIREIESSLVKNVIFISSTSVYPFTNSIATEETKTSHTPLAEIEKLFNTNNQFETTILRFGGLFGYDRKPGRFVKPNKKIQNPEGFINFIHRDDCIQIIEQIVEKQIWNEVLNACSDDHPKRRDFYVKEAAKLGVTNLVFDEKSETKFKIVSSEKLKNILNYKFKYADLMRL